MKTAEQFAKEFACTLTLHPSYAELHKMAQYASEMNEPLQEFILSALEARYAEIDKMREQAKELLKSMDELD
jgi:hypothetical protein